MWVWVRARWPSYSLACGSLFLAFMQLGARSHSVQTRCVAKCEKSPRAKFLRHISKRSAKNAAKFWRNCSQSFVLQFPGKMAAKNFTKNPRHFPRCTKLSFFTAAPLGASGPNFCESGEGVRLPRVVTGEHWTGSPNKSIDQIGKKCPKIVFSASLDSFWTFFGHFFEIFSDILSTSPFSGAVQRFARYNPRARD